MSQKREPQFQVYQARDGWRWRLVAANGRVVATGEAHTRRSDAVRAIGTVSHLVRVLAVEATRKVSVH